MSDSLQSHRLQHARPPCPSPTPRVYSISCPLSWWCHPTISSSVVSCSRLQSFPALWSFQMIQFFASSGQCIGVSASTSVLPMNIQDWFPLGWTDLISLQSKALSRVFSNTTVQKHQIFIAQLSFFFSPIIFISWRIITLQYCSGFCHTLTWISHGFTCVPHPETPPTSLPIPSLWVIPVHQPWALVSCIQTGLVIVSHLIMYMFQCYSLRSSHPCLLP